MALLSIVEAPVDDLTHTSKKSKPSSLYAACEDEDEDEDGDDEAMSVWALHLHLIWTLLLLLGKGADLTPPQISSLASPHRPKASDGSLEPLRREYL